MDCQWVAVVKNNDIDDSTSKARRGGPSVNLKYDERQKVKDSESWYLGRAPWRELH